MDYSTLTDAELSERVAERVMGWNEWADFTSDYDGPFPAVSRHDMAFGPVVYTSPDEWDYFYPARDWSAAGRVLERMRELGWDCIITIEGHVGGEPRQTGVDFLRPSVNGSSDHASLPRAICEAALKAMDAQEGA